MSDNRELLRTTSLKGLVGASVGGQIPVEAYARIIDQIRTRCGSDVATLFAEPVLPERPDPDNPEVTWYTPLDGQMVDLASVDEVARRPIVATLRSRLQKLKPVLEDPDIGPTVLSWLYIPSTNDILAVGGSPVLINWSYLPQEIAGSALLREKHFEETIRRYAPDLPVPPFTPQEGASEAARLRRGWRQEPSAAMRSAVAATPPDTPPADTVVGSRFGGRAPLIASIVAAVILLILLIPGVLKFPEDQRLRDDIARRAQVMREDNQGLEEQLRKLQEAARERVCRLPDGRMAPLAPLPGQPAPSAPQAPRTDLLPPSPDRIQVPSAEGPSSAPVALNDLLDSGVVFIVGHKSGSVGIGTGFFVTPDRIVTNRHVIEAIPAGNLIVTSRALGQALPARVIAQSPPDPEGAGEVQDFAILAVDRPGKAVLKLGPSPARGVRVVAVGYPGFLVEDDPAFQRLIKGDRSASPDSIIQQGFVIQRRESTPVKLLTHSANLGRGNSGGPLVDLCGRVVGVNTSGRNEGELATSANFAQDVTELRAFLQRHGIAPQSDDSQTPCPPAVASSTPPAGAPGTGTPAPVPGSAPPSSPPSAASPPGARQR